MAAAEPGQARIAGRPRTSNRLLGALRHLRRELPVGQYGQKGEDDNDSCAEQSSGRFWMNRDLIWNSSITRSETFRKAFPPRVRPT